MASSVHTGDQTWEHDVKKAASTNRKLVLGRESVRLLVELSAGHLPAIQAGMRPCPQCSEPDSGCSTVSVDTAVSCNSCYC
jgi:hypothetical protein